MCPTKLECQRGQAWVLSSSEYFDCVRGSMLCFIAHLHLLLQERLDGGIDISDQSF